MLLLWITKRQTNLSPSNLSATRTKASSKVSNDQHTFWKLIPNLTEELIWSGDVFISCILFYSYFLANDYVYGTLYPLKASINHPEWHTYNIKDIKELKIEMIWIHQGATISSTDLIFWFMKHSKSPDLEVLKVFFFCTLMYIVRCTLQC